MYLRGLDFTILTDHKPLVQIFGESSTPNPRQERWVLRMQSYRYSIVYVPRLSDIPLAKTFDKQTEEVLNSIVDVNRPAAITMNEIVRCSKDDNEIQKIRQALYDDNWDHTLKGFVPFKSELCLVKHILLRKNKIVIPYSLRATVLQLSHVGHPGKEKMKRRLRVAVWWPRLDAAVEKLCRTCVECQMVGQASKPEPLRVRELPSAPWVHLSADFLGPLPSGKYIFVLVDLYSRFVVAEITTHTTSNDVIRMLRQIFAKLGLPMVLTTDNAKNFSSQELKDYCVDYGIKLTHTTPYWPSANGEVERQNRSLLKVMKISQLLGSQLEGALQEYLYMYALTPHSVTGVPPATLMFGRRFRDLFPHVQDEVVFDKEMRERDAIVKHQAKENRDRRVGAKESNIKVGDEVLMKDMQPRNKLSSPFLQTPATVIDRQGSTVTVETPNGQQYKRNTAHLNNFHKPEVLAEDITSSEFTMETPESGDRNCGPSTGLRPRRENMQLKRYDDYLLD
ncbi:uncharacterized protein K02A2.6-like [Topomyia yanbarensis]|uniref:uncharacterized protein K02A2.6-like n=1 Tax=Topomyia yanbarensis TaxID=2498891 RepID=UPI00273C62D2|nr:uncharacterized protein K02A2.6-like [Topomyia yanbarensis]